MTILNITYPDNWNPLLTKHFEDSDGLKSFIKQAVKTEVIRKEIAEVSEEKTNEKNDEIQTFVDSLLTTLSE